MGADRSHLGVERCLTHDPKGNLIKSSMNVGEHPLGFNLTMHSRMSKGKAFIIAIRPLRQPQYCIVPFFSDDGTILPAHQNHRGVIHFELGFGSKKLAEGLLLKFLLSYSFSQFLGDHWTHTVDCKRFFG